MTKKQNLFCVAPYDKTRTNAWEQASLYSTQRTFKELESNCSQHFEYIVLSQPLH